MKPFRNVLITGGAGFIGSSLAHQLVQLGAKVTVIDSLLPGGGGNLFNLHGIRDAIEFYSMDLSREGPVHELLNDREFSHVFNLAGLLGHWDSMLQPQLDLESNVLSHLHVLRSISGFLQKPKVIFASTRQVYGKTNERIVTETHPVKPVDLNGANKYCAEEYHRIFSSVHGIPIVIFRLTNVFGPRQALKGNDLGVAPTFIGAALRGEPIHLFAGGLQRRDFLYVDDVVGALLKAAGNENCNGEIFNLGGHGCSLREFVDAMQVPDLQIQEVPFPNDRALIDIGSFETGYQKFHEATGWEPTVSLASGLKKTFQFYRSHGEHYF